MKSSGVGVLAHRFVNSLLYRLRSCVKMLLQHRDTEKEAKSQLRTQILTPHLCWQRLT